MKKAIFLLLNLVGIVSLSLGQTVTIGTQVWMTKNLDVDHFRNGDPIPEAKTAEEWEKAGVNKQPAWCYYDNDPANGGKYGKLYNWYAVNDERGLAPEGYHVTSDKEWTVLTDFLGGGGEVAGEKMKSKSGWEEYGNGNNSSGFSGFPGGWRYDDGYFNEIGEFGLWWSSSEDDSNNAWGRLLGYHRDDDLGRVSDSKDSGLTVRCLRD